MRSNHKAKIALEALNNNLLIQSIAAIADIKVGEIERFKSILSNKAYLAFVHEHLDTAVSALATHGQLSVVQVGANDGKSGDPVFALFHKYAKKALLIEPVPELIEGIRISYSNFKGELIIENVAIGPSAGEFSLWRLKPEFWQEYIDKLKAHPTMISSFDSVPLLRKVMERLKINDESIAKARIECLTCPMLTLYELLNKHDMTDVDVLQIDCEGYDFVAIESLGDIRPRIINFESFNLKPEDWASWRKWASKNGYGFIQGPMDTLAILGSSIAFEY